MWRRFSCIGLSRVAKLWPIQRACAPSLPLGSVSARTDLRTGGRVSKAKVVVIVLSAMMAALMIHGLIGDAGWADAPCDNVARGGRSIHGMDPSVGAEVPDVTGSFWTGLIERIDLERRSLRWPEGSGSAPSRSSPRCVRLRCSWHRVKAWPLPVRRPASPSRVVIGAWRDHYNRIRPHSALGYRPPAPVTRAFAHHLPTPNTMQ